jgi:hypothetical protein
MILDLTYTQEPSATQPALFATLADKIEHVFASWPAEFDPPPYRVVDPPTPVIVHIATVISSTDGHPANALPLRVRAEGLALDVQVPGKLWAWARVSTGAWIARVSFQIPTGNGRGYLEVDQWCPVAAVRPAK